MSPKNDDIEKDVKELFDDVNDDTNFDEYFKDERPRKPKGKKIKKMKYHFDR